MQHENEAKKLKGHYFFLNSGKLNQIHQVQ